jgi:hypothetical protein
MDRREFGKVVGLTVAGSLASSLMANAQTPKTLAAPKAVAGVPIIDSAIAKQAAELSREVSPPYLFNHASRTYLFGALMAQSMKLKPNLELLYLACILHDLGLTERYMGDKPFEIQGAIEAKQFLTRNGLSEERAAVVWDGIAFHPYALAEYRQPEIAMVAAGAGMDVVGGGLSDIPASAKIQVVEAFPRLEFKTVFVKSCADVVSRYPREATRSFMRDIGERYVPNFHPRNICDAIQKAPFEG